MTVTVDENGRPTVPPVLAYGAGGGGLEHHYLRNASDPDGDTLTITDTTDPAHGTVVCTPAGDCVYTPDPGRRGSDSYDFTASDGHGHAVSSTATLQIEPAPVLRITSAGPLSTVGVSEDLNCAANHVLDVRGEWYGDTACGTFAVVGDTLYSPTRVPAGAVGTPWRPLEQSPVTGDGTATSPYTIVTKVAAGHSGVTLTQTDTYVLGAGVVPDRHHPRHHRSEPHGAPVPRR